MNETLLPPLSPSLDSPSREAIQIALRAANLESLLRYALDDVRKLRVALDPLVAIADAYDDNELDDEARKRWGKNLEHESRTPHDQIELYSGRGGAQLLTLADAMRARSVMRALRIPRMP